VFSPLAARYLPGDQ